MKKLLDFENIDKRIRDALEEDCVKNDVTSLALIDSERRGKAFITAREKGVLCGLPIAERCFKALDSEVDFEPVLADGAILTHGDVISRLKGNLRSLFASERLALNLLGRLSGIATLTAAFVNKAAPHGVRIFDTRKTTPLWRDVEKYAVRIGGGENHRMNLSGACFVKDTHIDANGGMEVAMEKLFQRGAIPRPIIVEARTLEEAEVASRRPVDVILLDNATPEMISHIITVVQPECEIEISGGITFDNIEEFARSGASRISIGSLTHSVKSLDIALEYEE